MGHGFAPHGSSLADRIAAQSIPEPNTGCWLWLGTIDKSGYGRITYAGGGRLAHRMSYIAHKGPIADGLHIDHLCRVVSCVNPQHLEPVTQDENCRRAAVVRTQCVNGHTYTEATMRIDPRTRARVCRPCQLAAQRRKSVRR